MALLLAKHVVCGVPLFSRMHVLGGFFGHDECF